MRHGRQAENWLFLLQNAVAQEILANLGQGGIGLLSVPLDQSVSVTLAPTRLVIECHSVGYGEYRSQLHIFLRRVGGLALGYFEGPEVQEGF